MGRNPMRGFGTFGGDNMLITDTAVGPKTYHCAYCHTVMRNDRCKNCGSTTKVCNSHNNHSKKNYTGSGGPQ